MLVGVPEARPSNAVIAESAGRSAQGGSRFFPLTRPSTAPNSTASALGLDAIGQPS
jgi:hypothetical protein